MKRITADHVEIGLIALYILLALAVQCVYTQHFIADDSYFYMTTARYIALTGEQTFSGIYPTNGVHPLWLYVLSLYSWLGSLISTDALYQPICVIPISAGILGAAAYLAWQIAGILAINRFMFTALPLGFLTTFPLLGSEAYLTCFCLLLLIRVTIVPTRSILTGLAVALVVLARLDTIFLAASFYLWYAITQKDAKKVVLSGAAAALPVTVYMISNAVYFGGVFPISGWLKSSFPELSVSGFAANGMNTTVSHYHLFFGIVPLAFSTIILVWLRNRIPRQASIVYALWGGSVLHMVYTAGFTVAGALWYYVPPVMLAALSLALAMQRFERVWRPAFSGAAFLVMALALVGYAARDALQAAPNENECQRILDYLAGSHIERQTIITADCPGETAFRTTNRVIGLDMLTANRRLVDEMRQSPNGFQFIFDRAAREGKPVTYLIWTTSTWLGILDVDPSARRVSYWFRHPVGNVPRYMGTVELGAPVIRRSDLVVWKVATSDREIDANSQRGSVEKLFRRQFHN